MSKQRGGPRAATRPDDGRLDNPGRPPSPYIERRGEIAVKVSPATRTAIELISLRRQIDPRDLIAQLVEEARQEELSH